MYAGVFLFPTDWFVLLIPFLGAFFRREFILFISAVFLHDQLIGAFNIVFVYTRPSFWSKIIMLLIFILNARPQVIFGRV